jgi:hypothetical protein
LVAGCAYQKVDLVVDQCIRLEMLKTSRRHRCAGWHTLMSLRNRVPARAERRPDGTIVTLDTSLAALRRPRDRRTYRAARPEGQRSMRPAAVVAKKSAREMVGGARASGCFQALQKYPHEMGSKKGNVKIRRKLGRPQIMSFLRDR